jgi:hypothetical protein
MNITLDRERVNGRFFLLGSIYSSGGDVAFLSRRLT